MWYDSMMRFIMVLCLVVLPVALGCARQRLFTPATDVDHVMRTRVDPAANLVWASVVTTVTVDGVHEKFPNTAEEWSALRNAAADLAESGNLLMKENRVSANSDWGRQSQSLIAAAAARSKPWKRGVRIRFWRPGSRSTTPASGAMAGTPR